MNWRAGLRNAIFASLMLIFVRYWIPNPILHPLAMMASMFALGVLTEAVNMEELAAAFTRLPGAARVMLLLAMQTLVWGAIGVARGAAPYLGVILVGVMLWTLALLQQDLNRRERFSLVTGSVMATVTTLAASPSVLAHGTELGIELLMAGAALVVYLYRLVQGKGLMLSTWNLAALAGSGLSTFGLGVMVLQWDWRTGTVASHCIAWPIAATCFTIVGLIYIAPAVNVLRVPTARSLARIELAVGNRDWTTAIQRLDAARLDMDALPENPDDRHGREYSRAAFLHFEGIVLESCGQIRAAASCWENSLELYMALDESANVLQVGKRLMNLFQRWERWEATSDLATDLLEWIDEDTSNLSEMVDWLSELRELAEVRRRTTAESPSAQATLPQGEPEALFE